MPEPQVMRNTWLCWTGSMRFIRLPPGQGRFRGLMGVHQPVPFLDVQHLSIAADRWQFRHADVEPIFLDPEIVEAPEVMDRPGKAHGDSERLPVVLSMAQVAPAAPRRPTEADFDSAVSRRRGVIDALGQGA